MSELPLLAWIGIASIWIVTAFNIKWMIRNHRRDMKIIREAMAK